MLTGRCLCGGVRYEIDGEIGSVVYCHCSQCRRASGTALAAEGDLAVDHPQALVVIVRVRRVVGVGRIDPEERLEAVGDETGGERLLRRRRRAVPRNSFETHGADSPFGYPGAGSSMAAQ